MDAEKLSAILEGFLSPEENLRKEAENVFSQMSKAQPDELAGLLLVVLRTDPLVERRQQAAIAVRRFLRELFLGTEDNVWVHLNAQTKTAIKTELINLSVIEGTDVVRKAIGDIISDLGAALISTNEWPELSQSVMAMCQHSEVAVQILGLNICANLEPSLSDTLCAHMGDIAVMLQAKLEVKNNLLRIAAVGLIVQIVNNEVKKTWSVFEKFLPAMVEILKQLAAQEVASEDSESLSEMLQKFIELAESSSEYFKPHAKLLFDTLLGICREPELLDESRHFAAELVMSIVEQKPKMCARIPGFLDNLVQTLMDFMLDIDEDKEWMERELTCEDDEETGNFDIGEYGLDRVASAVGGDVTMPIIFAKVGQFLQANSDWQHKTAGIVAISQTVEYLPEDKVESQLGQVIDLLISQVTDAHYRVRFAACRALGQVALDHQPYVQQNFHEKVLPALIGTFDDPVARVQSQAFAAFLNFAEEVDIEDLLPVVPAVMEKIFVRMDLNFSSPADKQFSAAAVARQHRSIREQCITTVAVIAGVLSEKFLPYSSRIVPLMKTIVAQCTSNEDRQLRGRALECLSIIAYSVGSGAMGEDSVQIVNALVALYLTELAGDDPVKDYVHEALRRMIKVLGVEFAKFVPEILPRQLATFNVTSNKVDPSDEEASDYTLICMTSGDFSGVKTSKLEDIEKELALLAVMVESVKGAFMPWVQQAMTAVVPLLEMKYSDAVRRGSLVCIGELIAAARDGNAPTQQLSQWTLSTMEVVFKCVTDEEEIAQAGVDHLTANICGLTKCLDGAGPSVLEAGHVQLICQKVFELIAQSSQRRYEIEEAKKEPDVDEEDVERCDEEAEREQMFRETLLRVLESIIKNHRNLFLENSAKQTLEFVSEFVQPSRPADDRSLAVFVCCDILEQLGTTGVQLLGPILNQILLYTHDANPTVRQAACFAMSLCMKIQGIEQPLVIECAKRLVAVVNEPKALEKENRDATENAIAGLFATCVHQQIHLADSLQEHVNLIVSKLPLSSDDEEGQKVHKQLLTLLLDEQSPFWGQDKSNVAQLMKIFGAIYKTHLSDDETDLAIRTLISKIGFANLPQIISQITVTPTERRGLQKIQRDFTTPL